MARRTVGRLSGADAYLNAPPRRKYPVGKIAGIESLSYHGSYLMHKLVFHDGKYWLQCAPDKLACYSYMGFREAVKCPKCRKGTIGESIAADSTDDLELEIDVNREEPTSAGTAARPRRIGALRSSRNGTGFSA